MYIFLTLEFTLLLKKIYLLTTSVNAKYYFEYMRFSRCCAHIIFQRDWGGLIELVGLEYAGSYLVSVKNVSPQNGGFISKTVFCFEIDKNLSCSQRNLLDDFLLLENLCKNNWIIRFEQYR